MSQGSEQGVPNPRGRKSVPWRRDSLILARLQDVERRHLKGETNVAIAEALGVDEATVRNDLKRLNELWLERTAAAQDDNRARILAELEDVRVRALEAAEWDQMCERAVLFNDLPETDATTPDGEPARRSVYRDAKGSAQFRGNKAAALAQARQATMDKAKLLGLVVDKAALTDTHGEDLPLADLMERFNRRREKDAEQPHGGGA
jgi:hypothetical protein